ncbi:helix-turn-helix domain-containing protein [Cloacibacillus sp. An23]|uniref:helix-turn-helix domain-containing protein n=1 Tax=Cloacibacillus sp. An23 TaxID=1965591 RepID=UPI000B36E187|nr:helix-turn-helix domain-containing protein [Cloacibacillus sp. An23]OUO91843.1 hypothetical protein B5F39_11965 [Cloacibacillus sp. An23]
MNPNENMNFRDNRDFWFSHLDIQVMQSSSLSFYAKGIYALLTTYMDIRTRSWSVKVKTLAETAGLSERQVRYALKELKDMGIITSEAVYKDGHQKASVYTLIGHRAECFRKSSVQEVQAENGADCTPCRPTPAPYADRLRESVLRETNTPIAPQGGEYEKPVPGTRDTEEVEAADESESFDLASPSSKAGKKKSKPRRAHADNPNPLDEWFERQFWPNYPRHVDKKRARNTFMRVLSKARNPDEQKQWVINMGVRLAKYIEDVRDRDEQYIKHPSTWLNAHDFSEPPEESEILRREVFVRDGREAG